ncbi:methionyl-tRNA formyltransferase [bacterium]|nr:methionyl-tRNA formyltransferase [bacterium]
MKVVFFGTPQFAVPFVRHLNADREIKLEAVVTQPDKPVGRKREMTPPPVKEFAQKMGIPVFQPEKVKNNKEFIQTIKDLKPEFIVVVAYGAILPKEILEIPKCDCINVHASLLPRYRGASPIQSALLKGDKETGVSFMSMDEKLDAGDIYLLKKVTIADDDNQESLFEKLSDIGATLLPSVLRDIKDQILTSIPQYESLVTYCKKISKDDAQIYPEKETAINIENKLRAFTPWPGIYMIFKGKRLKLIDVKELETEEKLKAGEFSPIKNKLLLGTKSGILEIKKIQPEGKKPMSAKEFINGFLS